MANPGEAIHLSAREGQSRWIFGQLLTFKLYGQCDGVGIFEMEIPPGGGAPPHLHRGQDETHYVLGGEYRFICAGKPIDARAGSVVHVPRGTAHAFTNTGDTNGRLLFVETPAGPLEQWLDEIGDPVDDPTSPPRGEPDMARLARAAEQTGGIEFVDSERQ
jgi:mannose-6-phosphate isomerase-like protein (cupin superfamily)